MCRLYRLLLPLLLVCAQTLPGVAVANGNLLWKVSAGSGTAYLFGSIHFGSEDMYPLDTAITRAFEDSDALVVEIDMFGIDTVSTAMSFASKGMYTGGETLQGQVQPSTWRALTEAVKRYGMPIELFQLQKPWFVALTLSALEFKRIGFQEELGIDYQLLQRARDKKTIIELESIAMQLGLFENLSESEEEAFLIQTLEELEKGAGHLANVVEAWQTGNAQRLRTLITESLHSTPESKRIYKLLFSDRNVTMQQKIEALLQKGGTYFVTIGAGHLVGKDGVVQMFRNKGYAVQQL